MLRVLRYRFVLLVGFLFFCNVVSCFGQEGSSWWLVSPELLKAGNLEIVWQNKLPMREGESLEQLFIPFDSLDFTQDKSAQGRLDNRIYGLSDRNYMVSLNREKGNVIFSRPVAEVGLPIYGLRLYENQLYSLFGDKLVEISPEFGTEISVKRLGFGVVCTIGRNRSYYYVVGADRRLHALRTEDKVQVFEVAAENDSAITSTFVGEDLVIFATNAGNVISIMPGEPKKLWQFDAADGVVEPIVRDASSLFFASKDTNVYKINVANGKFVWKYQMGAVLERGPRVTEGVVYQYVRDEGLVAIDKKSGKLLWQLAEGVDLLAETDGKAYVIGNGKLVVMDNKKAKQLYSVNFAGVSRYAVNVVDSRIYIADESGRIACLKPIE